MEAELVAYLRVYQNEENEWVWQASLITGAFTAPSDPYDNRDDCIKMASLTFPDAEIRYGR